MSKRRSLSFADNEDDILEYFDNNGQSKIAKEAMKFYKENKDKVLTDNMINLIKLLGINNQQINNSIAHKPNLQDKFTKLKK